MKLSKPNCAQLEKNGLVDQYIALATLQKEFDCCNEEFAKIMGYKSARNYLRYYNGERKLKYSQAYNIANHFKCPVGIFSGQQYYREDNFAIWAPSADYLRDRNTSGFSINDYIRTVLECAGLEKLRYHFKKYRNLDPLSLLNPNSPANYIDTYELISLIVDCSAEKAASNIACLRSKYLRNSGVQKIKQFCSRHKKEDWPEIITSAIGIFEKNHDYILEESNKKQTVVSFSPKEHVRAGDFLTRRFFFQQWQFPMIGAVAEKIPHTITWEGTRGLMKFTPQRNPLQDSSRLLQ